MQNYFLLPWKIPQEISRRSMLRQYLPNQTHVHIQPFIIAIPNIIHTPPVEDTTSTSHAGCVNSS